MTSTAPAQSRRGSQARPRTSHQRRHGPRISWSRRAGLVLGLLVLGSSIVLAGRSLDGADEGLTPDGRRPGAATSAPTLTLPPPMLEPLPEALVATQTVTVRGRLPGGTTRGAAQRLRIYVNDRLVRERRLPGGEAFTVRGVPLERGQNTIRAALYGPAGEGLHGPAVFATRDDVPPVIHLLAPRAGTTVHRERVALRGRSEAGASLTISNEATAVAVHATADSAGSFQADLVLAMGRNAISVTARDAAGNRGRTTFELLREESAATLNLTLSRESLELAALPTSLSLSAHITDQSGAPVDGADVTFSLSPPGQPTSTYRSRSEAGVAVWRAVRLPREGARAGRGFATVLVVLPDGQTLQASVRFTIR